MVTIHDGLRKLKKQLKEDRIQEIKEEIETYAKREKLWGEIKKTWNKAADEDIESFIVDGKENIAWLLPEAKLHRSTGRLLLSLHKKLGKEGLQEIFERFAKRGVRKHLQENMPIEQEGTWRERYVPLGEKLVKYLRLSLGGKNFKDLLSDKWGFLWLFEPFEKKFGLQRKYRDKGMGAITGSFIDHRANYQEYLEDEIDRGLKDPLSFDKNDMTRFEKWLLKFHDYLIENGGYKFLKKVLSESIKEREDDLKEMILEVRFFDKCFLREKPRKKAIRETLFTSLWDDKSFLDQLLRNFVNEILPSNIWSPKELRVDRKKLEDILGRREFKEMINGELGPEIYDQIMSSSHKKSEMYLNRLGGRRGEKQKSINDLVRRKIKDKIKKGMEKIWKEEAKKALKMRNELLHRGIKILGEIALLITMLVKAWSIENNKDPSEYGIYAPGEPKGSIK